MARIEILRTGFIFCTIKPLGNNRYIILRLFLYCKYQRRIQEERLLYPVRYSSNVFGGVLVAPHIGWYVIVDVRVGSPSA